MKGQIKYKVEEVEESTTHSKEEMLLDNFILSASFIYMEIIYFGSFKDMLYNVYISPGFIFSSQSLPWKKKKCFSMSTGV